MKSHVRLSLISAFFFFSNASEANSLVNEHFYIGGSFGSYQARFNTTGKLFASSGGNPFRPTTNGGDADANSYVGNGLIGFGFKLLPIYIGAEANYAYFNGYGEASNVKGDLSAPNGQGTDYKVQQSLSQLIGLSAIIGKSILLSSDSMVYLRAGWVAGKFNSESQQSQGYESGYSGSFEEWQTGGILGAGIRAYLTNTLGITAEYDYLFFSSFKKTSSATAWFSGGTADWTYRPRVSWFSVGLVYDWF